jgi:hypothetical protein
MSDAARDVVARGLQAGNAVHVELGTRRPARVCRGTDRAPSRSGPSCPAAREAPAPLGRMLGNGNTAIHTHDSKKIAEGRRNRRGARRGRRSIGGPFEEGGFARGDERARSRPDRRTGSSGLRWTRGPTPSRASSAGGRLRR